jgi:hypothetical protein
VVSELIFGFRGTPLLLRVWLGLDRSSLSWVCDKPGFSGRFCSGDSSVERGMVSSSRIEIEKFNGKNFELWKLKMEDLLVDKEQWIVVDPGTQPTGTQPTGTQSTGTQPTSTQTTSTPPTGMSKEDWEKLDRRARSTIRLCLADSVLLNVSGESTTKELWDKLGNLYQSKSLVNKLFLRKKLYHLRMEDGDSVTEHLNAFNTLVSQLVSVNITIAEEDKCITLLCSLPDSWDNLVVAIGSTTQSTLKYEDVVASLLSEEMRWKSMDGHSTDALFVRGHTQDRNPGKSSGGRSKSTGRSKSPGKSLRKCWKCGKTGHYKKDCKSKKVDKPKGSDSTSSTEAKTSTEEGGDVYLASTGTHADHDVWLIDSGASYHMTPHREWFSEYEKYDGGDVFLGDDSTTKIMGRGRVKLLLKYGRIRTLPGVLHIPKLARSLISVSKLDDVGVDTVFGKNTCKMVRGAMVLMRGVRCGTLYKLLGSTYTNGCNSSVVLEQTNKEDKTNTIPEKKTMLWHQRLGHIGEKGLQTLHVKAWLKVCLIALWILISVNIAYMVNIIE